MGLDLFATNGHCKIILSFLGGLMLEIFSLDNRGVLSRAGVGSSVRNHCVLLAGKAMEEKQKNCLPQTNNTNCAR